MTQLYQFVVIYLSKTTKMFSRNVFPFLDWVKFNQLTIDWSKTKLMFITLQRIVRPSILVIDGLKVEVVDDLRIDHNLFFLST